LEENKMIMIIEILFVVVIAGSIMLASLSVTTIRGISKRPCNGELKQLAHLDGTIDKFNQIINKTI